MTFDPSYQRKELYGGAIVANVPSTFIDSSDIRQVPDHQEVFLDRNSNDNIIFEINQRVEEEGKSTDTDALRFHAEDIIEAENPTTSSFTTIKVPHLPEETPCLTCFVSAPADASGEYTGILMLLMRLVQQKVDVIVTFNLPALSAQEDGITSDQDALSSRLQVARAVIAEIVDSFEIKDWSLFAENEE